MAHSKAAFEAHVIASSQRFGSTLCFIPMDDDGFEIARVALKSGKPVMIAVHTARNPRHHRLLFAVFKKITEAGVVDWGQDQFLDWAKSAAGLIEQWWDCNGRVQYRPKSIAFESMPQDQFARFFDRVIFQIFARLIGEAEGWQAFRDEIVEMVDGDLGKRAKERA